MLTCVFISLALSSVPQRPVRSPYVSTHDVPWSKTGHPLNGRYRLTWDDKIDGTTEGATKTCDLSIRVQGDRVVGEFPGPIAGETRRARIEGRLDGGNDRINLLTFRQIEPGYTCAYQLTLGTGSFVGVWHDTKGRSGDFLLLKYQ